MPYPYERQLRLGYCNECGESLCFAGNERRSINEVRHCGHRYKHAQIQDRHYAQAVGVTGLLTREQSIAVGKWVDWQISVGGRFQLDRSFRYTPAPNFNGCDGTFTFYVRYVVHGNTPRDLQRVFEKDIKLMQQLATNPLPDRLRLLAHRGDWATAETAPRRLLPCR